MEQQKAVLVDYIHNIIEKGKEQWIDLGINKISDIKVEVKLVIDTNLIVIHIFIENAHRNCAPISFREYIYYSVDRKQEIKDKGYPFPPLSKEEVIIVVDKIEDYFKNVHFDRFSNSFQYKTSKQMEGEFKKAFLFMIDKVNDNIETSHIECCICKELTCGKTPCKHPLCYYCWDKIQHKSLCECCNEGDDDECSNEDKNCGLKLCPICRKDIEHCNHNEEDDD